MKQYPSILFIATETSILRSGWERMAEFDEWNMKKIENERHNICLREVYYFSLASLYWNRVGLLSHYFPQKLVLEKWKNQPVKLK